MATEAFLEILSAIFKDAMKMMKQEESEDTRAF